MGHGAITRLGDGFILLAGGLGLFLEAVQDVYRIIKFGDVHHTIGAACIFDAYFSRASADAVKRLPVVRV